MSFHYRLQVLRKTLKFMQISEKANRAHIWVKIIKTDTLIDEQMYNGETIGTHMLAEQEFNNTAK